MLRTYRFLILCLAFVGCDNKLSEGEIIQKMQEMLSAIEKSFQDTKDATGISELDKDVKQAIESVPREKFVPAQLQQYAYENKPLSIGEGQTISQPFIVALMTQLLNITATSKILEVGTGSGYQAAVLAKLAAQVYSIERIPTLANSARERLERLGFNNVSVITGDGTKGLPSEQPFDGIVVTAGGMVTNALKAQLKKGARLVIPIESGDAHILTIFTKEENGDVTQKQVLNVKFVPLIPEP